MADPQSAALVALPVQYVEFAGGVILKRGRTEIKIEGTGAEEAVRQVLEAAGKPNATPESICELFAAPDRPAVQYLIEQLVSRRILVPADDKRGAIGEPESALDVLYWHFGTTTDQFNAELNRLQIPILGVNLITRQLVRVLTDAGVCNVQVIDDPLLRNQRLFVDGHLQADRWESDAGTPLPIEPWADKLDPGTVRCLVATSDFGGQHLLLRWNEYCVERNIHFFPVILHDAIGYIGPLVIPGDSACMECLRIRQNSHFEDPEAARAPDFQAQDGQMVTAYHPAMASVLGDVAAMELTKFYGRLPQWQFGKLIQVNLLATTMKTSRVLKVPRCPICSSLNRRAPSTTKKGELIPGHRYSERYLG